ncbi:hypothetical protein EDB84DRAFT_1435005 [Lactarius hengduanensis]|nr:hypothetical protein EDB84DRAFT_1435005 [Lactarius hengduanensis]
MYTILLFWGENQSVWLTSFPLQLLYTPSFIMGPWVLLVTHDLRALGTRSRVATTSCDDTVDDLKTKVKEKRKVDLAQVDVDRLTVWKLKGENIINKLNFSIKRLAEILGSIDIDDVGTIEELDSGVKVADIGLPSDETLLVQMPAVALDEDHPLQLGVGDPITFKVDRTYKDCFLQARTKGGFEEDDITRNDIEDAHGGMFPDFVMTYEETLCRKRKVDGDGSEVCQIVILLRFQLLTLRPLADTRDS